MKILFFTDNFPPEVNAPATRTFEHCSVWNKLGCDVEVVTSAPNFPKGKIFEGYKNNILNKEIVNGIKVTRLLSYISANRGFFLRVLDFISLSFTSFIYGLFKKADVIITTSPQFFLNFTGYFLSVLKRTPWVMEVRDLWPESIKAVGALSDGLIYRTLEKLELFFYKRASLIVVVTDSFKKNLTSRNIPEGKIVVIKNGVNLDFFRPPNEKLHIKENFAKDKKIVGYLGTLGMAHKLDFIVKAAANFKDDVLFVFVGDGAEKENLIKLKDDLKASNVVFYPMMPKDEMINILGAIDIGLVNLKKSDTFKSVIPSKIFELSAMQKPIILGVEGESREMVEGEQIGVSFLPESEKGFCVALKSLLNNPENLKRIQDNQKIFAEKYSREELAKNMLNEINKLSS